MWPKKPSQSGFTLVELVVVIVLLAVLASVATSRFTDSALFRLQTTRDDIVAGLFYAQQLAMARGDTATIEFDATANSINVQQDNTDLATSPYPLALPSDLSLSPITTLVYDKLGRTANTTFTLTDSSGATATITVEATGYAH